MEGKEFR
jgi:P-type Ca2+ transporter type 2B